MAVASAKPGCVERAREGEILSKLKSLDFSLSLDSLDRSGNDPKNRNKIVQYMHHYGSNTDQKTIVAKTKLDRCSCRIRECFFSQKKKESGNVFASGYLATATYRSRTAASSPGVSGSILTTGMYAQ